MFHGAACFLFPYAGFLHEYSILSELNSMYCDIPCRLVVIYYKKENKSIWPKGKIYNIFLLRVVYNTLCAANAFVGPRGKQSKKRGTPDATPP